MNNKELTKIIKDYSVELGFDLFGATAPTLKLDNFKYLDEWISNKYHASMLWIKNRQEERKNIYKYFPEVKSIISLGHNYYSNRQGRANSKYKISNYAWGDDYHELIKDKLEKIMNFIKQYNSKFKYYYRRIF